MTTPHKWANVIKAWADGKSVQWKHMVWNDFPDAKLTMDSRPYTYANGVFLGQTNYEWRIKPETVRYRRCLWKPGFDVIVGVCNNEDVAQALQECSSFIRWIDLEWQEVEV